MKIKLDKTYDVKTTLGTIREIENLFGQSFLDAVGGIATMKLDDQIKLLYAGVKKANPTITQEKFTELCEDHLGLGELMEYIEKFIFALQYPGLTEKEVQERVAKKFASSLRLQKASKG